MSTIGHAFLACIYGMRELADIDTDETVGYYEKGEIEPEQFVEDMEGISPEDVEYAYFRNVPNGDSPTGRELREVDEQKPGVFRVTVAYV